MASPEQESQLIFFDESRNHSRLKTVSLEVLSEDPNDELALACLCKALYSLEENDKFVSTALDALGRITSRARKAYILEILTEYYRKESRYSTAERYIKEALVQTPDDPDCIARYAEISAFLGRRQEFETEINRALSLAPRDYGVLRCKFKGHYFCFSDREQELRTLQTMLDNSASFLSEVNFFFGLFHEKYGEVEEAYGFYQTAFLIDPESRKAKERLIETGNRLGRNGFKALLIWRVKKFWEKLWMVYT